VKVQLRFVGTEKHGELLAITIDGRQALLEGPRRVGHCVYCAGQCIGATTHCEVRVFSESRGA
jgi:hypothetical protein